MFDHIGIRVKNLDASVRFYKAALEPLGYVLISHEDSYAGFGPPGQASLWLYPTQHPTATAAHLAFHAKTHKAVDGFHHHGLKAGGHDNGKPGIRADYSDNYYAAFL